MNTPVPQCAPLRSYLKHKDDIDAALKRVAESGWYVLGEEVRNFETAFASFLGARGCLGVANGTDALALALRATGVEPNDLVLTVSHTAVATVSAIEWIGAVPVLVDVNSTLTMDVDSVERTIDWLRDSDTKRRIAALLPVHLYGHPCDMDGLQRLAEREGIPIIEDCAQAHGAEFRGRKVGTIGTVAAFSFYPTKNLGALGDGGALVSNDADVLQRAQMLRQYGWQERFVSECAGWNSRLDELQAAVLSVKLRSLDVDTSARRAIAEQYTGVLKTHHAMPLDTREHVEHAYHQYVVRSQTRDQLAAHLLERGVRTAVHYPMPVHLQPAYKGRLDIAPGGLPVTEAAATEILSLPMFPELSAPELEQVHSALASCA